MTILHNDGDVVLGEFTLDYGDQSLTQSFAAHRVGVDALRSLLGEMESAEWLVAGTSARPRN